MNEPTPIEFEVNGQTRQVDVAPMRRLLDVLRIDLELTGTKEGCGEGECGACAVLLDGMPVNSCLVPVGQVHGRAIRTVEDLAKGPVLSAVQKALVEHGGAQCGICTPGIVVTATAILAADPNASRAELREQLAGNLCRCTGYQRIIDAVVAAQQEGSP